LIVLALGSDTVRLVHLQERLPGISAGVLDNHLQQLTELGVVSRRRLREMPPRVEIELTESGCELFPIAGALARWGMRRVWFSPESREQVDIGTLLRILPVLLEQETRLPDGWLETIVATGNEGVRSGFLIENGRLRPSEAGVEANAAAASIEGDEAAWIAALGPARDYTQLRITGRKRFAKKILDALPGRE
jgi:DNA-binding HxlR family transcriptional regulator